MSNEKAVLAWRRVYPRERQSDVSRKLLGLEGQAVLDNLMDAAWMNGGTLPTDDSVLAMLSLAGERWPEIGPKVLAAYFKRRGKVYVNVALLDEMADAERRVDVNVERAKKGAAKRWGNARSTSSSNASSIPQGNAARDACEMPPSAVSRQIPDNREQPTDSRERITDNGLPLEETSPPPSSGEGRGTGEGEDFNCHGAPDIANRFIASFNGAFDRRCRVSPGITGLVEERLKDGYPWWQIVAQPILVVANCQDDAFRAKVQPEWVLRDGKQATSNGGRTNWLEREFARLDQTTLWAKLHALAEAQGVWDDLHTHGVGLAR